MPTALFYMNNSCITFCIKDYRFRKDAIITKEVLAHSATNDDYRG